MKNALFHQKQVFCNADSKKIQFNASVISLFHGDKLIVQIARCNYYSSCLRLVNAPPVACIEK